jgi:hypothetical protein
LYVPPVWEGSFVASMETVSVPPDPPVSPLEGVTVTQLSAADAEKLTAEAAEIVRV